MKHTKIAAIMTMLVMVLAMTAVSGCTSGNMSVTATPTAAPTATPTAMPTVAPTAAPVATPTATAIATPAATATATAVPSTLPYWKTPYPTMGPWTPGDDTYVLTPTEGAGYLISSPWVDQKIQVVGRVVLKITGNVDNPLSLKMTDLQSYPQRSASFTNKKGETSYGKGPELNALLNAASPGSGATSIKLIASDGATYTISLSDIRADSGAIVSMESDGSLRSYIPTRSSDGKAQLRGLIEIQVI